jgi:hypothetical protein
MSETKDEIFKRLLEAVQYRSDWALTDACKELETAQEHIAELESELATLREAQRWIPIEEQGIPCKRIRIGKGKSELVIEPCEVRYDSEGDATHWRPLPKPPQEVEG